MLVVATVGAAAATGLLSLLTGLAFARSACRRVFTASLRRCWALRVLGFGETDLRFGGRRRLLPN